MRERVNMMMMTSFRQVTHPTSRITCYVGEGWSLRCAIWDEGGFTLCLCFRSDFSDRAVFRMNVRPRCIVIGKVGVVMYKFEIDM